MEFIVEKKIKVLVGQDEKGNMAAEGRWLKNLLMMLAIQDYFFSDLLGTSGYNIDCGIVIR